MVSGLIILDKVGSDNRTMPCVVIAHAVMKTAKERAPIERAVIRLWPRRALGRMPLIGPFRGIGGNLQAGQICFPMFKRDTQRQRGVLLQHICQGQRKAFSQALGKG